MGAARAEAPLSVWTLVKPRRRLAKSIRSLLKKKHAWHMLALAKQNVILVDT